MIQELADILKIELNILGEELIEKHDELGMRASSEWARSVETSVQIKGNGLSGMIKANDYTVQLQFGRRPGKFPPISAIESWIDDKRISSDIPKQSLAFLIARKISREGTDYFKQGGTDLVDSVITDERIAQIISKLEATIINVVVGGFVSQLKRELV